MLIIQRNTRHPLTGLQKKRIGMLDNHKLLNGSIHKPIVDTANLLKAQFDIIPKILPALKRDKWDRGGANKESFFTATTTAGLLS
jgi:hypothetical protein